MAPKGVIGIFYNILGYFDPFPNEKILPYYYNVIPLL